MGDVKVEFKGNKFSAGLDSDGDGVKSIKVDLHLSEALQEAISAFKKGEEVETVEMEAKAVKISFDGGVMKVSVDPDKDGEELLNVEANLMEAVDEGMQKFRG